MRYIDAKSIGYISTLVKRSELRSADRKSSFLGISGLGKMTKAQRKKITRRRFRMFVDNIIMHHKRLHDKNRDIPIKAEKERLKTQNKKKTLDKKDQNKWRKKYAKDNRAKKIKERINARRIRSKSKWTAIIENERRDRFGNF